MNDNTIKINDTMDVYENEINILCDNFIAGLRDPEEIYNNNGVFVLMLKYAYKNYIKDILNNTSVTTGNRYNNIKVLDSLFNIYTSLVYKYKANKKPLISEYCIFTNIDRTTIYDWKEGNTKSLTPEYSHTVKNWFNECENALVNAGGVFEIFQLKACYHWNDNLQALPLENQGINTSIEQLPVLELENNEK